MVCYLYGMYNVHHKIRMTCIVRPVFAPQVWEMMRRAGLWIRSTPNCGVADRVEGGRASA